MPAPPEDDEDTFKKMDEEPQETWPQQAERLWTVSEEMVKDYM